MTEKDLENQIIDYLRMLGIFCYPLNNVGVFDPVKKFYRKPNKRFMPGVSDIHAFIEGKFVAIEVKAPKGKVSPEQLEYLHNIRLNGSIGLVVRSIQELDTELAKHFAWKPAHLRGFKWTSRT